MTYRFFYALCLVLLPAQINAHSWLDRAPPLNAEQISIAMKTLNELDAATLKAKPKGTASIEYIYEIASQYDSEFKTIERVLFTYEAIKLGELSQNGFSKSANVFRWNRRIKPGDFEAVSDHFSKIDAWYNKLIDGGKN